MLDYAVSTAEAKGIEKGKHEEAVTIAKEMKKDGLPLAPAVCRLYLQIAYTAILYDVSSRKFATRLDINTFRPLY